MQTRVLIASTRPLLDDAHYMALYRALPPERRARADAMARPQDRRLSVAAGTLLYRALRELGVTDTEMTFGAQGKPRLTQVPSVHFNLSHSHERVMCVLAGEAVGCDVERTGAPRLQLARRFFCPAEYERIAAAASVEEQTELFYRFWTLKESFMKATGQGMALSPSAFEILLDGAAPTVRQARNGKQYFFRELSRGDGYCYAVCAETPEIGDAEEIAL